MWNIYRLFVSVTYQYCNIIVCQYINCSIGSIVLLIEALYLCHVLCLLTFKWPVLFWLWANRWHIAKACICGCILFTQVGTTLILQHFPKLSIDFNSRWKWLECNLLLNTDSGLFRHEIYAFYVQCRVSCGLQD